MKKFLIKTFAVLFPVLALVVVVNYFGDAANLFSNNYEYKIADGMIAGKNVTNIYNFDERLLQKILVTKTKECPDVVIVGSSRTMLLHSGYFPGKKVMNNSVSAGTSEDILSILELYDAKGCLPEELIIGINPDSFLKNIGKARWKTLEKEHNTMLKKLSGSHNDTDVEEEESKYWQLVSPSYFSASLKMLKRGKTEPLITDERQNDDAITHHPDGSITYDKKYREPTRAQVREKAAKYQNTISSTITSKSELSENIKNNLDNLVKYLDKKKCKVTFFVAPLNPQVYNYIMQNNMRHQLAATEKYCAQLQKKYSNVSIIGSFNPAPYNMDESYFYDGNHCNLKGIDILMAQKTG